MLNIKCRGRGIDMVSAEVRIAELDLMQSLAYCKKLEKTIRDLEKKNYELLSQLNSRRDVV